jgi:hypothetical protein
MLTDKFKRSLFFFWFHVKWQWGIFIERAKLNAGYCLPRWLVACALVRAAAHGTTGRHGDTNFSEVRLLTVMKRWDSSND